MMKPIAPLLTLGLLLACSLAARAGVVVDGENIEPPAMAEMPCAARPFSVLITVQNVKEGKGQITADLHDNDPARWLKGGQHLVRVRVPALKGTTQMCVPVPIAGTYAIAIYHDKNANGLFDKGFMGIPVEPYGISNNPPMAFGPPKLDESSFTVDGKLVPITIKLKP